MRPFKLSLALAGLVACAAVLTLAPGPASASAPAVAAWWSASNLGAVAAPPPPDVKSGDLFVQGSNVTPAGVIPGVSGPPSAQAIAALMFTIPDETEVGSLRLALDPAATPPPAASIVACRVTKAFRAVQNGPYSDIPSYDDTACVPGELSADGTTLAFPKVATLVRLDTLSVALVPGPLDRVVLAAPTGTALTLNAAAAPAAAPPFSASEPPAGTAPASSGAVALGSGADPGANSGVATGPLAAAAPSVASPVPVPAPALAAPAPTPASAAASGTRAEGARGARLLAGIGLLALLVFSVLGWRRSGPVSVMGAERELGVGRFRSTRAGKAPRLS